MVAFRPWQGRLRTLHLACAWSARFTAPLQKTENGEDDRDYAEKQRERQQNLIFRVQAEFERRLKRDETASAHREQRRRTRREDFSTPAMPMGLAKSPLWPEVSTGLLI
jgi:hypothetical protein